MLAGLAAFVGVAANAAEPGQPPVGRWRCYQPPAYTVTAWFDLEANGTVRVNGGTAQGFVVDSAKSLVRWSGDAFGNKRFGRYMAPGSSGGDANRHTLVLLVRDDARPGAAAWERLERCYLTTH